MRPISATRRNISESGTSRTDGTAEYIWLINYSAEVLLCITISKFFIWCVSAMQQAVD